MFSLHDCTIRVEACSERPLLSRVFVLVGLVKTVFVSSLVILVDSESVISSPEATKIGLATKELSVYPLLFRPGFSEPLLVLH